MHPRGAATLLVSVALALAARAAAGQPSPAEATATLVRAYEVDDAAALDEEVAALAALIDDDPPAPYAARAAIALLAMLVRNDRLDDVEAWMRGVRERPALLADGELARWLDRLAVDVPLRRAQLLERAAAVDDGAEAYRRCAAAYLEVAALPDEDALAAEALYNAGVCFTRAREPERALDAYDAIVVEHPRSPLVPHALRASGELHAAQIDLAAAATAYEALATRYPGQRASEPALRAAIAYRAALGELPAAERDVEHALALWGAHSYALGWDLPLALAAVYLERGAARDRDAARGWLRRVARGPWTRGTLDPWALLAAARLFHEASCPVATDAGLCVDRAGAALARDRELAAADHRAAGLLLPQHEPTLTSWARLTLADEQLEQVLAPGRAGAGADDARAAYRAIADDDSASLEARLLAVPRLARVGGPEPRPRERLPALAPATVPAEAEAAATRP